MSGMRYSVPFESAIEDIEELMMFFYGHALWIVSGCIVEIPNNCCRTVIS